MRKKDLWNTVARLEDALVAKDIEMEELEKELESYVTIRPTDVPDRYDLWDGSVQLLEGATTTEIAHFIMHGHGYCDPHPCPNRH